jgi:type I restriction enzyme S subunit
MAFNQDLKALECRPGVDSTFLFHSLFDQRETIRELASEASHGTKKLDTAVLERLPILVADGRLQRLFRDTTTPLLVQRDNLHKQNVRLRTARNILLPRLMNGEIAV